MGSARAARAGRRRTLLQAVWRHRCRWPSIWKHAGPARANGEGQRTTTETVLSWGDPHRCAPTFSLSRATPNSRDLRTFMTDAGAPDSSGGTMSGSMVAPCRALRARPRLLGFLAVGVTPRVRDSVSLSLSLARSLARRRGLDSRVTREHHVCQQ
jgi:hypothetical protein